MKMINKHKLANQKNLSGVVTVIILATIGVFLLFASHAAQLPGDANGDGVVNISDLAIVAAHYGTTTGATWAEGDFNGDGKVNVEDLSILAAHWGDTVSVSSPTISFGASSTDITTGSNSTLTWSTTNATSCTASGSWSGSQSTSGSFATSIFNSPASNTYNLSCSGSGGSTSASVVITAAGTALVTAGNSKANCVSVLQSSGAINDSQFSAVTAITGVTYNCVVTFNNPQATWDAWDNPWQFRASGWGAWVAERSDNQVILGEDLIPSALEDNSDPLTWEQQCDAGDFNTYATTLGQNLVADGGANTIFRLGIEANGGWEVDYVGTTTQEQNAWAQCFDTEVTTLRAVTGSHFLFVWNPNICTNNLPLNEWYPGNNYVDIIGADAYDEDCNSLQTVSQEGWTDYSTNVVNNNPNDPNFPSLANIEAFAVTNNKPLAFPEWGEAAGKPDDATYVNDIANMVNNDETSFQAWFDCGCDSTTSLGPSIPLSTTAYGNDFK
jgi:hypothetical protein